MKEKIEQLIESLRIGSKTSERQSNDMIRDITLRAQDETLSKVYTAFANDLQIILDSEYPPETVEESKSPTEESDSSIGDRLHELEKRLAELTKKDDS